MAPRQRSPIPQQDDETPPSSASSSPPIMTRKQLIEREDSSTVSTTTSTSSSSSSLSTTTRTITIAESDIARDKHDIFNLFALLPVVMLTMVNYDWEKVTVEFHPAAAWHGQYFMAYWSATMLYFIVDLIWVAYVPICVKSPTVIIKHHFIALVYLIGPLVWPQYRWFMGACLSVEVNTWFLIARRVVYKRNLSGTTLATAITACFYISWIVIRCIIYPGILVTFLSMAAVGIVETQSIMHWELLFLPIHFFLCVLNLKWTYDLFQPIIVTWWNKTDEQEQQNDNGTTTTTTTRVSNGL